MNSINQAYINALLADATYVNVAPEPQMNSIQLQDELERERMTPELAMYIAANFEVASAINSPDLFGLGSGFDATVWRGRDGTDFAGQVFVSTRGTELGVDWGADVDLAVNVAARSQIIDMVNWWLRETAPEGLPVKQLLATTEIITEVDPLTNLPTERVVSGMRLVDGAAGTGRLVGTTSVQVNGHSLGGHLASAFARIFGGDTPAGGSVHVESVATFNSAGFNGDNAEYFFAQIQSLLGTGLPSFDAVEVLQTNFFAENGIEVTTNTWWFEQMGTRVGLEQEETSGTGNHSMYRLTDLLALGAMLEKLDPALSFEKLNTLVSGGSNFPAASLEGVLDALRKALAGPAIQALPTGDAGDNNPARATFHATLVALQANPIFESLEGRLNIVQAGASLASTAKTDFGAFIALQDLSSLYITGKDAAANAELTSLWQAGRASDYIAWAADRNARLYGDTNYTYSFSEQWYEDRAALLRAISVRNEQDNTTGQVFDANARAGQVTFFDFVDPATGQSTVLSTLASGVSSLPEQFIAFGAEADDTLTGSNINRLGDRLYGGAGNDTLNGMDGNDHLEGNAGDDLLEGGSGSDTLLGGTGNDTLIGGGGNDTLSGGSGVDRYEFSGNFGNDQIIDSDGNGSIWINGMQVTGGKKIEGLPNSWISDNKLWRYELGSNGDLLIRHADSSAGAVMLRGWQGGGGNRLGIELSDETATATEPPGVRTYHGDQRAPLVNGSYNWGVTSWLPNGVLAGGQAESDFADVIRSDRIDANTNSRIFGYGGNDALGGGYGNDTIDGGEGDDLIAGGGGSNVLIGGAGNDFIAAGSYLSHPG